MTAQTTTQKQSSAPGHGGAQVVDIVRENARLREEAKKSESKHSINYLAIIVGESVVIVFLVWLTFFYYPLQKYIPTQNAAAICAFEPIDKPNINAAQIVDYAKDAVVTIYSTDYANYRRTITNAADKFMVPDFRSPFMQTMSNSDFLKALVNNQFTVTAITTPNQPPQVVREGVLNGAYAWKVQVPLTFYYTSGRQQHDDRVVAEVTVTRTDPTKIRLNPSAIGVSWIDLKTAVN
ncbi:TPA: DotI/IcmL family type IV secretion protein [Burkholderia cenocepacia]|nr:DotI/IcmL family type IV secretion protein [Burkholderia cenocepacia]